MTDGSQQGGCGGTLVAENWVKYRIIFPREIKVCCIFKTLNQVITAAHCFFDNSGNQVGDDGDDGNGDHGNGDGDVDENVGC